MLQLGCWVSEVFLCVLQLKCCGMTGDVTSNTSWAIYKLESNWFKDQTGSGEPPTLHTPITQSPPVRLVPTACVVKRDTYFY